MNRIKSILAFLLVFISMNTAFSFTKQKLLEAVKSNNTDKVKEILSRSHNLSKLKYDFDGNSILMIALDKKADESIISGLLKAGCSPDLKNNQKQTALMLACKNSYSPKTIKQIITYGAMTKSKRASRVLTKDKSGKNSFEYAKNNSSSYNCLLEFAKDPAKEEVQTEPKEEKAEVVEEEQPPVQEEPEETTQEPQQEETQTEAAPKEVAQETEPSPETEQPTENKITEEPTPEPQTAPEDAKAVTTEQPASPTPSADPQGVPPAGIAAAATTTVGATTAIIAVNTNSTETENSTETAATEPEQPEVAQPPVAQPPVAQPPVAQQQVAQPVVIPQINYYNKDQPEYLFDQIEDTSVSEELSEKKVTIIQNPDVCDTNGKTRLMHAIMQNDLKLCYDLLYSGANVNAKDKEGWTPIMYACRYAEIPDLPELLFTYGAKLNTSTAFGVKTLQIAAAFSKNKEIINIILVHAQKQKLNIASSFVTALQECRPSQIIAQYIKFIPNINKPYNGKTFLMYACENYETTDVIKLLLESGADPYIISSEKKNAFSYAKANSNIVHDSVYWSLNVSADKK